MVNWIKLKFGQKFNVIIMLLHNKFEPTMAHEFQENLKMDVCDSSMFLDNHEAF